MEKLPKSVKTVNDLLSYFKPVKKSKSIAVVLQQLINNREDINEAILISVDQEGRVNVVSNTTRKTGTIIMLQAIQMVLADNLKKQG